MIGLRKYRNIRESYEDLGGKHFADMFKFIPEDVAADERLPHTFVARILYSFYKAIEGRIVVNNYRERPTVKEVMTLSEAAEIWGVSKNTLAQYAYAKSHGIRNTTRTGDPRNFFLPTEARLSGKTWLVTWAGMCRCFGDPNGGNPAKTRKRATKKEGE